MAPLVPSVCPGTGEPGKGVSSFHLWWQDAPPEPVVAVEVTLEVVEAPVVDRLYFWALQATFNDATTDHGGAHLGLQWNPRYPGSRAANWGGYANVGQWGVDPRGHSVAAPEHAERPEHPRLPVAAGRAVPLAHLAVRRRMARRDHRHDDRAHAARARPSHRRRPTDVADDVVGGLRPLRSPERDGALVEPEWTTASGRVVSPTRVRVTFPSGGDCPNTDVGTDGIGVFQRTNTPRTHRDGDVLVLPA